MEQRPKRLPTDGKKPRIGPKHTWTCRTHAVGFLRNAGGPYGVRLILSSDNAMALKDALEACVDVAAKAKKDQIRIDARWGKRTQDVGFRLDVRAHSG